MMQSLFWFFAGLVVYVYFGYPLFLVAVRALGRTKPISRGSGEPRVSLIISAYNEEASIGEKLANSLQLEYPADKLEILVVSDASTDRTDEIVSNFRSGRVRLIRMSERGGKTVGLNRAVREAHGEVIVFSDANALYGPEAIRMLVRNFDDPYVGAAIGESTYVGATSEAEQSESLYWKYEVAVKRLESDVGSVVGGDGAIYAIRRALYREMRADALSDFVNPLQIVEQGYRVVYEPAARSHERAGDDFGKEFRRKIRIVNRAWRATFAMPQMMNPVRYGLFAIELVSHKLLRWLVPVFLVALFCLSALLMRDGAVFLVGFALQAGFYVLAIVGWLLRRSDKLPAVISVPFFFCLVNVASARGILDAFRGKTYTTWSTIRAEGQ